MKKIEAIIRPEKLNQVKVAMEDAGVKSMTVSEVQGRGEQKGLSFINRAGKCRVDILPKTMLTIVVQDKDVDSVISRLVSSARTGEMGDGKIFVSDVPRCIRIRTG